jgi:hypothetical protein
MRKEGSSPEVLKQALSDQFGESSAWPTDEQFESDWMTAHVYQRLNNPKLIHILRRLSNHYLNSKHEKLTIDHEVTVEHLLPQGWITHWPLPSGATGLSGYALHAENAPREVVTATGTRNAALQTFGNLTILTQSLNSTVRNSNWATKKPEIMKSSLLSLNQMLHEYETWSEESIIKRGKELLGIAKTIWPGPNRNKTIDALL